MLSLLLTLATALGPQAGPAQTVNIPCCETPVDEGRPSTPRDTPEAACCPACEVPAAQTADDPKAARTPRAPQAPDAPWASGWYLPY